jgi:hypothetical protein
MDARKPRALLLVMMDIDPEHEAEFERWYTEEHLPDRAHCPGFLSARRFQAIEGGPKYMAFYELEGPEVLESDEYRKIRYTDWTRAMEPRFKNFVRNVYVEITPEPTQRRRAAAKPSGKRKTKSRKR